MADDQWPHLYREGNGPVIITLHGYGGNEEEVSGLASWLDPSRAVLSPRGTVDERGMFRWYGRFTGSQFDPFDIEEKADALMGFLRNSATRYSFSISDALVSGFSNGAAMAIALAVLFPAEVRQVAAFSGVFPFHSLPASDLTGVSVWSSHGDGDVWVSEAAGMRVVDSLTTRGARVGSLVRPGGHGITEEEIAGAKTFFGIAPSPTV